MSQEVISSLSGWRCPQWPVKRTYWKGFEECRIYCPEVNLSELQKDNGMQFVLLVKGLPQRRLLRCSQGSHCASFPFPAVG
jgi:hypothetical protein